MELENLIRSPISEFSTKQFYQHNLKYVVQLRMTNTNTKIRKTIRSRWKSIIHIKNITVFINFFFDFPKKSSNINCLKISNQSSSINLNAIYNETYSNQGNNIEMKTNNEGKFGA